jgi:hypothetical protein
MQFTVGLLLISAHFETRFLWDKQNPLRRADLSISESQSPPAKA